LDLPAAATAVAVEADGIRHRISFSGSELTVPALLTAIGRQADVRDLSLTEPALEDLVRRIYARAGIPGEHPPPRTRCQHLRGRTMARSYATVGQMLTYAMDRSVQSAGLEGWTSHPDRADVVLRHMLEFVLMAPRSRSAFLRTAARTEHATGSIVAAPRLRRNAPDLVAEMFPSSTDDGARLGIALRTGG